jgi:hypothetical protein
MDWIRTTSTSKVDYLHHFSLEKTPRPRAIAWATRELGRSASVRKYRRPRVRASVISAISARVLAVVRVYPEEAVETMKYNCSPNSEVLRA